ncbi:MAG: hypothetical protein COB30_008115 [Ectothiorhodospiraceae bacterium]|nr:hypothetical protein [Ectothiorhodospiraceae bacterium]
MSRCCTHESCFADTTCALGNIDRVDCEHWLEPDAIEGTPEKEQTTQTSDVPWNGYALGTRDLTILGGRGCPLVIGLIGPPDSGKTSLLAFVYMWLLKHGSLIDWQFAGSWTLGGWESVVQHCRWTGEPPPSFPPHTSSSGRYPGMLHVTFRDPKGRLQDVLFADAPGEWFTQWARVPGNPTADGARWVIEHADALLMLIDSAALADAKKLPHARRATRDLLERIGAVTPHLPMTVVWTKDDVEVPTHARDVLERACAEFVPHANMAQTTVNEPETIAKCFMDMITAADSSVSIAKNPEPVLSNDPFLAFRGLHVEY